ncbi:MAG: hypothetical protein NTV86_03500 [Planctomycetota bacterium]|nr:hypothetical protein [Planctomycetota bacterium]
MAENGGGVAVRRADADGQVELGLPLTPALREATVVPTRNDNSRFNVSVVAGPVPEGSDRGHVVLAVAGLCMPVWGRSDRRPDGSVSVEATVMGQEAAGRVAEELGVKPVVRTHPGHQFTATLSPERADYLPAEVVTLVMTVKNTGQTTFRFWDGGKQRGYRNNQFSFQARRKEGKGAQVPDTGNPEHFGGMMAVKELKPGEVFRKPVEVTRWFQFDSPDTYLITGTFGLELLTEGNKTIWDDAATVSCSVRVLSPATRPAPGGPTATTRAGADSTGHPAAGG